MDSRGRFVLFLVQLYGGIPMALLALAKGRTVIGKRFERHAIAGLVLGGIIVLLTGLLFLLSEPVEPWIWAI